MLLLNQTNKFTKVILYTENFESYSIPKEEVADFTVQGVTSDLSLYGGKITEEHKCTGATFKFKRPFLQEIQTAGGDENGYYNLEDRLRKMPDIVDFDLITAEGTRYNIILPWTGETDGINDALHTSIDSYDNLLVVNIY